MHNNLDDVILVNFFGLLIDYRNWWRFDLCLEFCSEIDWRDFHGWMLDCLWNCRCVSWSDFAKCNTCLVRLFLKKLLMLSKT